MIIQTPWLERKFNFDFPGGLYPVILTRLAGTSARAKEMVEGIPENILSQKHDNKWSAKQHIGHLIDLEELHEKRFDDFMRGREILSAWDTSNTKTENANHNQTPVLQILVQLKETRSHFVKRLESVHEEMLSRKAIHPRLKIPIRLVDMAYFVAEHDDHHLARIRSILSS